MWEEIFILSPREKGKVKIVWSEGDKGEMAGIKGQGHEYK